MPPHLARRTALFAPSAAVLLAVPRLLAHHVLSIFSVSTAWASNIFLFLYPGTPPLSPGPTKCHETLSYTTKNFQQQQQTVVQQQQTITQQQHEQKTVIQQQQQQLQNNGDIDEQQKLQLQQQQQKQKHKKCHEEVTHSEKKHSHGKIIFIHFKEHFMFFIFSSSLLV